MATKSNHSALLAALSPAERAELVRHLLGESPEGQAAVREAAQAYAASAPRTKLSIEPAPVYYPPRKGGPGEGEYRGEVVARRVYVGSNKAVPRARQWRFTLEQLAELLDRADELRAAVQAARDAIEDPDKRALVRQAGEERAKRYARADDADDGTETTSAAPAQEDPLVALLQAKLAAARK